MSQKDMNSYGELARNIWTVLVNEPEMYEYKQFWMSQKDINSSSEWARKI
jgi:hypothetical protein